MKVIIVILLIGALILGTAVLAVRFAGEDPSEMPLLPGNIGDGDPSDIVELRFSPKQCEPTPWEEFYSNGEIKFIKAPTDEEVAIAYYGSIGVELKSFSKEFPEEPMMVCQACGCPRGYSFAASVNSEDAEVLKSEGWDDISAAA